MGGIGSGRHGRRSSRSRTEDLLSVDISHVLHRACFTDIPERPGTVTVLWGRWEQRVELAVSRQSLGGRRWWFVCPLCRHRRRKLYSPWHGKDSIACRVCRRLMYTSQCLSAPERLRHRAASLYGQAGLDMDDTCRDKPRGMHWVKFNRLIGRAEAYETAWIDHGLCQFIERFGK